MRKGRVGGRGRRRHPADVHRHRPAALRARRPRARRRRPRPRHRPGPRQGRAPARRAPGPQDRRRARSLPSPTRPRRRRRSGLVALATGGLHPKEPPGDGLSARRTRRPRPSPSAPPAPRVRRLVAARRRQRIRPPAARRRTVPSEGHPLRPRRRGAAGPEPACSAASRTRSTPSAASGPPNAPDAPTQPVERTSPGSRSRAPRRVDDVGRVAARMPHEITPSATKAAPASAASDHRPHQVEQARRYRPGATSGRNVVTRRLPGDDAALDDEALLGGPIERPVRGMSDEAFEALTGGICADEWPSHVDVAGNGAGPATPEGAELRDSIEGRLRARLIEGNAILDVPPPRPLIGPGPNDVPVLDLDSLAVLYGPAGVGKTFLPLSLALSIARGEWWQ